MYLSVTNLCSGVFPSHNLINPCRASLFDLCDWQSLCLGLFQYIWITNSNIPIIVFMFGFGMPCPTLLNKTSYSGFVCSRLVSAITGGSTFLCAPAPGSTQSPIIEMGSFLEGKAARVELTTLPSVVVCLIKKLT